jgi:4-amino-4-deoxy-L-arabinose transferase-like glycosyltransferase
LHIFDLTWKRALLTLIVVVYAALGTAYAVWTPTWQAPDEPAHFNYIRHLAQTGTLPVLEQGDYPHDYLEEIKVRGFPPHMSIDPIRYESWQPPLYYLLATPIYHASSALPLAQQVIALRLFSVFLGCILLVVAYRVIGQIFPERPALSLCAVAFIATVPMHIAMTAAINNDTLAELILALILWRLIRQLNQPSQGIRPHLITGLLVGFGLITKSTTYVALPLVALTWAWQTDRSWQKAAATLVPAVTISLPWFVRNVLTYGLTDPLIMSRHSDVVIGQLRTDEWLAQHSAVRAAQIFLTTTFHSFWAQFGWMGFPVDQRIYSALALLCALVAIGIASFAFITFRKGEVLSTAQKKAATLLLLSLSLTLGSYLWYNLQFVQHQGRYLFPASIPLSLLFALGLNDLLRRSVAPWIGTLLLLAVIGLGIHGIVAGDARETLMLMLGCWAVFLGARGLAPQKWEVGFLALPFLGLVALDAISLVYFILPALS